MNQIENTTNQPQQQGLLSSESGSEDEFVNNIRKQLQNMDEEERSSRIISKNEAIPKPTAIQLSETREEREIRYKFSEVKGNTKQIGKIEMITKENIIISSILLDFVINLDQLLLTKEMEIIGAVDDVFGKVEKPHYSVFLDGYNKKLIEDGLLKVEDAVFVNLDGANILDQITIKSLMNKKGCDASNQFDEEILNQFEIEYSDDESEIQHKHKSKKEDGELKHKNHKKQKQNDFKQKNYQNDYQQKHQHQHQHQNQPYHQQQQQQALYNQQGNNKPQQIQQQSYGIPQLSQQHQIYLAQQEQLFQITLQQQQQYYMQRQLQQQQQHQQQQQQYLPFQQQKQGQQHQPQQFQYNLTQAQEQIPQYQINAILQSINPNVDNHQNQPNNLEQTQ